MYKMTLNLCAYMLRVRLNICTYRHIIKAYLHIVYDHRSCTYNCSVFCKHTINESEGDIPIYYPWKLCHGRQTFSLCLHFRWSSRRIIALINNSYIAHGIIRVYVRNSHPIPISHIIQIHIETSLPVCFVALNSI